MTTEILRRARELAPLLRERAPEIEANRTLPAEVVELLRATGVFGMCYGPEWGGPGLTSMEQTEVVEALAYGDASAAWCAVIGANTGIYANFLDQTVAKEVFPRLDLVVAGLLQPSGRAERVPGGFRLSGRWSFGSGVKHADWVTSGAFIYDGGEPWAAPGSKHRHDSRQFLVPREQVEVIDNWDTTGLCGSGSCDYTMDGVFVPEEHTYTFATPQGRPGPLAQPDSFTRAMCGVPLGVARAALDHAREVATTRYDRMAGRSWADSWRVQTELARLEAEFNAVREGVYGAMRRQWAVLAAGGTLDDLTPTERAASPLSWLHAFRSARTIVARTYDLLQTWSINRSSPMDRWLRDTTVLAQHLVAQDRILQSAGAYLLGAEPEFGISLGLV
ncbi:acyl-CoA dehydrogenase family protein [Kitasatospora sp. NA04385]|uniref:acyl-CoA dehydrogenase family protein n=1 Tax=Kitasatospora sp. NA04385 TaxID=2742135 RepID=UPI00159015ED|nr:acyl-CoA dehydrogenase family protein [Kitasatospora sp. NA04385]QKW18951.1 acyl-CoA dehydrogenase family protein [Kitasatospora sp. NA04385]